MALEDDLTHMHIVDFDPNQSEGERWLVRSSDQAQPCAFSVPMNVSIEDRDDNVIQYDGQHRRLITINGKTPSDPIVVPLGAEVSIRVHNMLLTEGVTLHIHGLNQQNLWWSDGVAYIQQCPIPALTRYTYRFIADTPGTHWFHGHEGTDRGEGLLGAFVVKDRDESEVLDGVRFSPSRDYVALLQDATVGRTDDMWYAQMWRTMKWMYGVDENYGRCWAPTLTYDGSMVGGSMAMTALLVNDKGWYRQNDLMSAPHRLPLETFRIRRGESVRLRIINGGVAQALMLSVEEHELNVVATDGIRLRPFTAQMVISSPGERYDVIIRGMQSPSKKVYFIVLETLEHYNRLRGKIEPFYGLAKLEYEDVTTDVNLNDTADLFHSQCSTLKRCVVVNCPFRQFPAEYPYVCRNVGELRSATGNADLDLFHDRGFAAGYEEYFLNMHWDSHVDGWMYSSPRGIPYYHEEDLNSIADWCDRSKCPPERDNRFDNDCHCFLHLNITLGNIVQLTLYNMGRGGGSPDGFPHPFHMHGSHWYVMKVGYPDYNATNHVASPNRDIPCGPTEHCNERQWADRSWLNGRVPDMNTFDPPAKDTVLLPAGGYVVLRFRATNPGWFFAHCHILIHHLGGTAFALRIGERNQMPRPPANFPHDCGDFVPPPLENRHSQ